MSKVSLPYMLMRRDEMSSDNHVFLHMDIISQQNQLPTISSFILTLDQPAALNKRLLPYCGDLQFTLPAYIAPFLTFEELQILFYQCYLDSISIPADSLLGLIQRFGPLKPSSLRIKITAIELMWKNFEANLPGPTNPLIEFQKLVHSKAMFQAVEIALSSDKQIENICKGMNKEDLSSFLDRCALPAENRIFNLDDEDFREVVQDLLAF